MPELKRSLAVIIGIDEYIKGIPPLQNAVNDAKKMAELLTEKYQYEVLLLLDSDATLSRLNDLLTAFEQKIVPFPDGKKVKVEADDRLLFYFAGHGEAPDPLDTSEGPAGYLIPQDGQQDNRATWLKMVELHNALLQLPCRHILIILDCCKAGTFRWATRKREAVGAQKLYRERYDRYTSRYAMQVITSAAHDEKAADSSHRFGKLDREISGHSPFAELLLQGLNGEADMTNDGAIAATELYLYLDRELAKKNAKQTAGICDFGRHNDGQYIFPLPEFDREGLPPAPILTENTNPYKGLDSFDEEDSGKFFGRTALTEELVKFVEKHQLTVVLGASGLGKSSLVKAGLIPKLKESKFWCILPAFRPEKSPFYALNDSLKKAGFPILEMACKLNCLDSNANHTGWYEQVWENLSKNLTVWSEKYSGCKLLLVIDQFEELFTGNSDNQEREMFLEGFAKALETFPDSLRIVVTLRDDFEYRFSNTALAPFWEAAKFDRLSKTTITREELRAIIVEPTRDKEIYFEPQDLVENLIYEVMQMPGGLPLLSFTLSELYLKYIEGVAQGKTDNRAMNQADYDELGGVAKSLTNRANDEYTKLVKKNNAYSQTIRNVMLRMVAIGGSELARRQVLDAELEYPEPEENARVQEVIQQFCAARLLVRGKDINGNIYTEPAHDILVRQWPKLQEWKHEKEGKLILLRKLTDAAEEWKKKEEAQPSGFQANIEILFDCCDRTLEFSENLSNKVIGKLVRLWQGTSDEQKDGQDKREDFLWHTNPRLDLLEEQVNSDEIWFNKLEAEFVYHSIERKHRNRRVWWSGAIALFAIFSVLSVGAAIYYKEARNANREAQKGKVRAYRQASEANLLLNKDLDALIDSLRAGKSLQDPRFQLFKSEFKLQNQVKLTLQNAVYSAKELNRIKGLSDQVSSMTASFSPKDALLATIEDNGTVCFWNLHGKLLKKCQKEQRQITSISFSPNGQQFATAGEEGTVRLWDLQGNFLKQLNPGLGWIRSISYSPKSQLLAIAGLKGTLLWNLQDGKAKKLPEPENNWIWNVNFSPDGQQLATAGADGIARLWNLQGKLLKEFPKHKDKLRSVSFSPDGKMLAIAGDNDNVHLWNLQNSQHEELSQLDNSTWNVSFSPDNRWLATAGGDGNVRLWNLSAGSSLDLAKHQGPVRSVNFSPDGKLLATAGDNDTIRLWDLQDKYLAELKGHQGKVKSISFSPDGQRVASQEEDRTVRWWNLQGQVFEPRKDDRLVNNDSCKLNGQRVVMGDNTKGDKAYLQDLQGRYLAETAQGHPNGLRSISCTADGKLLATAGDDGKIRLWDLQSQPLIKQERRLLHQVKVWAGEQNSLTIVQFSPDGMQLVTGGLDGTVRWWNLQGEPLATWKMDQGWIRSISFSLDGKLLTTAGYKGNPSWIRSISFSPDGKLLATAGDEGNPKLWRIESFDELMERGCDWVRDYLKNNPNVEKSDRHLCDEIKPLAFK
ncbi:nSTAND1 domain-containing NTPase [Microcoleus sp. B3-D7]|uniref:nSTAND1 domain-containing NTPase n=1 Tax=Microcoleus sp. B3-D7 TaxID=2818659 RepID=UPI002FD12809